VRQQHLHAHQHASHNHVMEGKPGPQHMPPPSSSKGRSMLNGRAEAYVPSSAAQAAAGAFSGTSNGVATAGNLSD
jgi:hypothetical protein